MKKLTKQQKKEKSPSVKKCIVKGCEKLATHCHYKYWKTKPLKGDHRLIAEKHPKWFEYLCDLHHAEKHGISPKKSELKRLVILRDRAIKIRNARENQKRGLSRIEYIVPESWDKEIETWNKEIKDLEKLIKKLVEEYPIWKWLKTIKGIKTNTAAKLVSHIDITNTPTVSALWRYCGLDPTHIKRRKKISQKEALKYGSPYLKKELAGVLGESFIKSRTPTYRKMYDEEKEKQIAKNKLTKGHAHRRAIRKMIKTFLKDFWLKWRKLEKLPVGKPYKNK